MNDMLIAMLAFCGFAIWAWSLYTLLEIAFFKHPVGRWWWGKDWGARGQRNGLRAYDITAAVVFISPVSLLFIF